MAESDKTLSNSAGPGGRKADAEFSSNCIRLSVWEWGLAAVILAIVLGAGPGLWREIEHIEPASDYRLSSESSDDYWRFEQYCDWACGHYDKLVVGDSAMRGYFVADYETLSHYLNELAGADEFANLAVDGMHPAALAGLLRYYGKAIRDKTVVVHLNPLWMSSKKQDLTAEKEFRFHHPRLIPQFSDEIKCYKAAFSERLSVAAERRSGVLSWAGHLRNMNIPGWTLEHPHSNPLNVLVGAGDSAKTVPEEKIGPWHEMGLREKDMPFVELADSLQWRFFKEAVELLKSRGNRVFVLVGPFNEHMLKGESVAAYGRIKDEIAQWLADAELPYLIAEPPESDFWRDASHPLAEGYAEVARQLFETQSFKADVLAGPEQ